jgi:hypothetical protein
MSSIKQETTWPTERTAVIAVSGKTGGLPRLNRLEIGKSAAWLLAGFVNLFVILLISLSALSGEFMSWMSLSRDLLSALDGFRSRQEALRWGSLVIILYVLMSEPVHGYISGDSIGSEYHNASSVLCNSQIRAHLRTYENNSVASRLPYGRAYIEQQFDQALYYYPAPHGVTNERRNSYLVRSCYLFRNQSDNSHDAVHHRTKHLCASVSLAGLLIGSEVVPPISITSQILHIADGPPICEWKVKFTDLIQPASFKLQIWTYGINELSDPTAEQMTAQKTDRHNSGTSVSLTGIGVVNTVDVLPFYDFTGHTVRRSRGKAIYFVVNMTTIRGFASYDAYLQSGVSNQDVVVAPDGYFTIWNEAFPPFDVDIVKNLPGPSNISEFISLAQVPRTSFVYGGSAHLESMIFNLPDWVEAAPTAQKEPIAAGVKLCRDSESLSRGRWVLEPTCEEHFSHGSADQTEFYKKFVAGDICQQTETTIHGDVPDRLRGLVWKPWECDMVQFSAKPISVGASTARQLNSSLFCDVVNSMDGSVDREVLSFSYAINNYLQSKSDSNVEARGVLAAAGSAGIQYDLFMPFSFCMRASRIAFLAGFGDSLGNEQLDNFKKLLGNLRYWSNESNEISCSGSSSSHLHGIEKGAELVKCIRSAVHETMTRSNRLSLYGIDKTAEGASASQLQITEASVPVTTVVLVTNLMAQHIGIHYSLARIEELLHEQAGLHTALASELETNYNLTYRRVFFSGIATHGFKANGLTNARQLLFADKARQILGSVEGGFEIVDMFNISLGRPDATADGIHYKGGVSRAMTDILANVLCVTPCKSNKRLRL